MRELQELLLPQLVQARRQEEPIRAASTPSPSPITINQGQGRQLSHISASSMASNDSATTTTTNCSSAATSVCNAITSIASTSAPSSAPSSDSATANASKRALVSIAPTDLTNGSDFIATTPKALPAGMAASMLHPTSPATTSPTMPSSPTMRTSLDTFGTGKRPLTDVKEEKEPLGKDEDGTEDADMVDSASAISVQQDIRDDDERYGYLSHMDWTLDDSVAMRDLDSRHRDDAANTTDGESAPHPIAKRQRADSSLSNLAARMGSRMPSFSRKWKPRKALPNLTTASLSRASSLSRTGSSRAPSFVSATIESGKTAMPSVAAQHYLPPTPTRSVHNDSAGSGMVDSWMSSSTTPTSPPSSASGTITMTGLTTLDHLRSSEISLGEADDGDDDQLYDQAKPTTPLLPPIMTELSRHAQEASYQSPLQSPSVANPDLMASQTSLQSPIPTPQIVSLPSPPLSTKPSVASFHHRPYGIALIPSSEIPIMYISAGPPPDKWADTLGHANFHILPEPYTPSPIDLTACQALRADWEQARCNFAKHLMRVGENAGPTSKIYSLTEAKWAEIDAEWKRTVDSCVGQLQQQQQQQQQRHTSSPNPSAIPSQQQQSPHLSQGQPQSQIQLIEHLPLSSPTSTPTHIASPRPILLSSPQANRSRSATLNGALSPSQPTTTTTSPIQPASPIFHPPPARDLTKTPPLVKIPDIHVPGSEGKFPLVGDEGIVGPMERAPSRDGSFILGYTFGQNQPSTPLKQKDLAQQAQQHQQQRNAHQHQQTQQRRKRKFGTVFRDWLAGMNILGGNGGHTGVNDRERRRRVDVH